MEQEEISEIVKYYDKKNIAIAVLCLDSSLQIFNGARKEGFRTIGICVGEPPKFYDAFPKARPDEFFVLKELGEILERAGELAKMNAIIIPHGLFLECLGVNNLKILRLPIFGSRRALELNSNRNESRKWIMSAGIEMPREILNPEEIRSPVLVRHYDLEGNMGFFVAKSCAEFSKRIKLDRRYAIQEFILGTRYNIHYFYSSIKKDGYELNKGSLEFLGIDKCIESNVDEIFRVGSPAELAETGIYPTFEVTGNMPLVLRESLIPRMLKMTEQVVEKSFELFDGVIGPFSLEVVVTDNLEIKVLDVSTHITEGTNLFISGSPYSDLVDEKLSMGQRIAREIRMALDTDRLVEVIS